MTPASLLTAPAWLWLSGGVVYDPDTRCAWLAADATDDSPGWTRTPHGVVYGADSSARLATIHQVAALLPSSQLDQLKRPAPPADHQHATNLPCSCDYVWLSGSMPPSGFLPRRAGVYLCIDTAGRVAYVGTSDSNVRGRLLAHHRDPEKPTLAGWVGMWPGEFAEPAPIWEIRLIRHFRPYLNRQYLNARPEISWTPQGREAIAARGPWWETDEDFVRFMDGPGSRLDLTRVKPWSLVGALRNLLESGCTWDEIDRAAEITAERDETVGLELRHGGPVSYMAGVARNLMAGW